MRSMPRCPRMSWRPSASFSRSYARLGADGRLRAGWRVGLGRAARRVSATWPASAPAHHRGDRSPTTQRLSPTFSSISSISRRRCFSRSAEWIASLLPSRAGQPGGAAECAGHRDPPFGPRREDRAGGRRGRGGFLRVHDPGEHPGADPERFLGREEGRAQGRALSQQRQGGVRGAAILGSRRRRLRRGRLDRPAD